MTPARAPDEVIFIRTTVQLCWRDWWRATLGRPIHVDTRQAVWVKGDGTNEVVVDQATSRTWVEAVLPRRPSGGGYEAVAGEPT